MQLCRHVRHRQPPCILDNLIAEDIQVANLDVHGRQIRHVRHACRYSVGRDVGDAGFHLVYGLAEDGGPGRQVVLIVPNHEGRQALGGLDVAIVEHRVDEDLLGDGRGEFAVAGEDGGCGGDAAAATVAHDGDAGWVDVELGGVVSEPSEAREAVFGHGRATGLDSRVSAARFGLVRSRRTDLPRERACTQRPRAGRLIEKPRSSGGGCRVRCQP